MTGITCNTIAEIQASAESGSGLGTEEGGPPEVAAREINLKCEPDAVVRPPPGRGEESGAEVRLSSGRGEEWLPSGRGEERLVPPPEGEGEGARLTTSAPPGRAACNIGLSSLSTIAALQRSISTPDTL